MKENLTTLKKAIIHVGRRTYERGYIASNDGNISARIDKKYVLITPSGVSKGFMNGSDLIIIDFNGKLVKGNGKPSSESLLHLQIYKERPDVKSVCHAHPPYATGFAVAGIPLDQNILPEVIIALGTIPLVPYGTPGTEEFSKPLLPILKHYDAFLLANHGALTVGSTVLDAYNKMETLEHFAKIFFVAQHLGRVNILTDEQTKILIERRKVYGVRENVGIADKVIEGAIQIKIRRPS
jgi:L-fuculose-phosphate aldolase